MNSTILILYLGLFLVMIFFFLRPQMKKQKEQEGFSKGIQKGDKVVTTGGIHGKVLRADEGTSLLLEIDSNTKIRIERSGISFELTKLIYGGDAVAEKKEEVKA